MHKKILLALLSIILLILIYYSFTFRPAKEPSTRVPLQASLPFPVSSSPKTEATKPASKTVIENTKRKLTVYCGLQDLDSSLKPIILQKEKWNDEKIIALFDPEGPFAIDNNLTISSRDIAFSNPRNGAVLEVDQRGITYRVPSARRALGTRTNRDEALSIVRQFIERHGGTPADAELITTKESSSEASQAIAFHFGHKYGGIEIVSDRIDVEVCNSTVIGFVREWREIKGESQGATSQYLTAKQALEKLGNMDDIGYEIKSNEPLVIGRSGFAYASKGYWADRGVAYPCYRFEIPAPVYIDGLTGARLAD